MSFPSVQHAVTSACSEWWWWTFHQHSMQLHQPVQNDDDDLSISSAYSYISLFRMMMMIFPSVQHAVTPACSEWWWWWWTFPQHSMQLHQPVQNYVDNDDELSISTACSYISLFRMMMKSFPSVQHSYISLFRIITGIFLSAQHTVTSVYQDSDGEDQFSIQLLQSIKTVMMRIFPSVQHTVTSAHSGWRW